MEKHSVEGGATPTLNPLALTHHFGQASATSDRKTTAEITKHPPHLPGSNHVVNKEGAYISETIFRDGRDAHSRKREGTLGHWKQHQRPVREKGEAQLIIKKS